MDSCSLIGSRGHTQSWFQFCWFACCCSGCCCCQIFGSLEREPDSQTLHWPWCRSCCCYSCCHRRKRRRTLWQAGKRGWRTAGWVIDWPADQCPPSFWGRSGRVGAVAILWPGYLTASVRHWCTLGPQGCHVDMPLVCLKQGGGKWQQVQVVWAALCGRCCCCLLQESAATTAHPQGPAWAPVGKKPEYDLGRYVDAEVVAQREILN